MEEEAREILNAALAGKSGSERNLADAIRRRFAAIGGVELAEVPREPMLPPLKFGR
jgi:plasmid stability protein